MQTVPGPVRSAFAYLDPDATREAVLMREIVARVCLDAIGCTGLNDYYEHNTAVSDARNWFRHDSDRDFNSVQLFDLAGIENYAGIRAAVLMCDPQYR